MSKGRVWTAEEKAEMSRRAKERAATKKQRAGEVDEAEEFPAPVIVFGEAADPEEMPEAELTDPEPMDDFDRFLMTLDRDTRDLLTDEELRTIYIAESAKARAERKIAAKRSVVGRASHHAQVEAGLLPVSAIEDQKWRDRMNEMVRFTVDLPELGDIGLRIDNRVFLHGHTYTVTRSEYDSMRSMIYANQQAELTFEGRGRGHWLRRQARGSMGGEMVDGVAVQ